ncbi:hypothetical protein D479_13213 [Halobacillus sp. BAB-2008]|nr:hypothetical protein D479_13213 [Halobacillus sp. BAB-2008]
MICYDELDIVGESRIIHMRMDVKGNGIWKTPNQGIYIKRRRTDWEQYTRRKVGITWTFSE